MKDDPMHYEEMPRYYKALFNAVTTALIAMQRMDFGTAMQRLMEGQKEAEELFICEGETDGGE